MPSYTTGDAPPVADADVRTAYTDEIYRDGEHIATCGLPEDAATLAALLNEAEETAQEYAASARVAAARLALAHSAARKLYAAYVAEARAKWATVDLALGMERDWRARRAAAKMWKRVAKDRRKWLRFWMDNAAHHAQRRRKTQAELDALRARIRALGDGATAEQLRDLVE